MVANRRWMVFADAIGLNAPRADSANKNRLMTERKVGVTMMSPFMVQVLVLAGKCHIYNMV